MATAAQKRKRKIQQFVWEGKDSRGKTVKGDNEAPNAEYVKATLRRQGIRPIKVRRKSKPLLKFKRPIKSKDISFATRQLATMIGAGIPVASSIESLARGHENPSMQEMLTSIRLDVESGTALSDALGRFPIHFDRLYTALVSAGEQSGTLDILLDKIAIYKEKMEAIKSKIRAAMLYPASVLIVAVVVVSILLIFVIPSFERLFQNFGADLPTLTRWIVDLSRWFTEWWWMFFMILVGSIVGIVFTYRRSEKMQFFFDRVVLILPIFGTVIRKAIIARFARTLSTMFGAGVPLVESLETVALATGNRVFSKGVISIRNEVSTGRTLEVAMAESNLFPSMVLQMVSSGEEAGELELMLMKVAEFFEREVDYAVEALASLIEPVMIVMLGIIVGVIVVAMYLPIFKMASVF
jgi:type IV pilus assembly protein PilC